MSRPVIGITPYLEPVDRDVWRAQLSVTLPATYAEKVIEAGGIPLVVPPLPDADEEWAARVLGRVDGLILSGGADVEAARYGAQPHPAAQEARPDRDVSELLLAQVGRELDVPTLGICRGMQVMAVAAGGTLNQHLPDDVGHERHSPSPGEWSSHRVLVGQGTPLAALLGAEVTCPTYHHQGVASCPGYDVVARAEDGVVEAIHDPSARWRLGVQWHPEQGDDLRLFEALVAACS
ncbi:gamma-glutamyl-gamma-aminobutyrate hydrolase family protein [Allobranchiibius huperziae]|uniref:Putative glutamine amidotransferase n=1 Tax=Allobranchiibius huperziae TaxID=1874116 RepID=A0A853DF93_9MICO|nr:putative glutamine amidotransferase [Allobranchiibius huperziae]